MLKPKKELLKESATNILIILMYIYFLAFIPVIILLGLHQDDFAYTFLMMSYFMPIWIVLSFGLLINIKESFVDILKRESWFYIIFASIQYFLYLVSIFGSYYGYYWGFLEYLKYKN